MKKRTYRLNIAGILAVIGVLAAIVLAAVAIVGSFQNSPDDGDSLAPVGGQTVSDSSSSEPDPEPKTAEVRMMAVGDNLIHSSIYKQALARGNGETYDFTYAYEQIADIIGQSDFAVLNQETPIAPSKEPSDYPLFNCPPSMGDLMLQLGFTVVNHSNNHVLDKGASGAIETIDYWEAKEGVTLTGVYRDDEDRMTPKVNEANGITFAQVGFTEYLNGLAVPSDSPLRVVSLVDNQRTREQVEANMKEMIELASESADVVVVSMHWQREDYTDITDEQRAMVQKLVDWGADVIIGNGPHVVQPVEYVTRADGTQALVYYSLGNFISAQSKADNMLGGIADVTFTKDFSTNKVTITAASFIPTVTHYEGSYQNIRIIPFAEYTPELGASHGVKNFQSKFNYDYAKAFYEEVIGNEFLTFENAKPAA